MHSCPPLPLSKISDPIKIHILGGFAVKKRSGVQDELLSDQSCPLPTSTRRLEPNDHSRFVIST